jgi:thiol-disulfide isomerase/thioredoxin
MKIMQPIALLFALTLATIFNVKAQVINNPSEGFKGKNPHLKITRIVLSDTSTVMYFTTKQSPNTWIRIPKETYIQPVGDTIKYFVKSTEGIPFNKKYFMPDSGIVHYAVIFPAIQRNYQFLDYGENVSDGWKIYDIALTADKKLASHAFLNNEWFNSNTRNMEFAFFKGMAIRHNKVWKCNIVKNAENKYQFELQRGKEKIPVTVARISDSEIKISAKDISTTCFNNRDLCKQVPGHSVYTTPVVKMDSATYSGYVKGFSPRYGFKTIALHVDNILSQNQDTYIATITDNGYFSVRIPLYHPQYVYVRSDVYNGTAYLEPGKELFTILAGDRVQFAGEPAALNYDLNFLNSYHGLNWNELENRVVNMSPDDYKAYLLAQQKKEYTRLDSLRNLNKVSATACQVKKFDIDYLYINEMMEYRWQYERAYRAVKKLERKDIVNIPAYPANYFNFISHEIANNKVALISNSYNTFINRIKYLDAVRSNRFVWDYKKIYEELKKLVDTLSENDKKFADLILPSGNVRADSTFMEEVQHRFYMEHKALISKIVQKERSDIYFTKLDSAFGISKNDWITDIMNSQDILRPISQEFTPCTEAELADKLSGINDPFIRNYIKIQNDKTLKQIEANKNAGGYFVNQTPNADGDKLFDAIMSKYKGKLVYVDFWATWCGPCRSGIREIQPLKEELQNKNIAFVYITDESSPEQTYKNMIPTIKGEHYRLTNDEYRYLQAKFNISGIPHYVLVDKNGKVISPELGHKSNEELKNLFQKYLEGVSHL